MTPRRPLEPAGLFLVAAMLLAGLVTIPQERLQLGPVTGGGALTLLICGGAWLLWFVRPYFPPRHIPPLLPLLLFLLYAAGSMAWYEVSFKGLQNLAVTLGFFGLILLAARETRRDARLARLLHRCLDAGTLFAAAVYTASVALEGMGADDGRFVLARPFALFALAGVARQLSLWQAGRRIGLVAAGLLVGVIFLSVSRVALVAAVMLFPLAAFVRGDRKGLAVSLWAGAVGVAGLVAAVLLSDTMYERFFGYDRTLNVGGFWINGSGRSAMWDAVWASAKESPVFGKGLGSAARLIDRNFPGLGHPHNDFLRFLHDFGLVGVACWLAFVGAVAHALWGIARRRALRHDKDLPIYLAPLLALAALSASMFTDNSVTYQFVMFPLGMLLGCALGRIDAEELDRTQGELTGMLLLPPVWLEARRKPVKPVATAAAPAGVGRP
jgi:O-antigen ligase